MPSPVTATAPAPPFEVEVFFDGECPLCLREIRMLQGRDRQHRIRFTDIAAPGFDPATTGRSWAELMDHIYGRLPDGSLIEGTEVFRRLYAAVGFHSLVALSRLPGVSQLLDVGYRLFAKNRLRLTGRCTDGSCSIHGRSTLPSADQTEGRTEGRTEGAEGRKAAAEHEAKEKGVRPGGRTPFASSTSTTTQFPR